MKHLYRPNPNLMQHPPDVDRCRASVSHGRMGLGQCSRKPLVWETVDGERVGLCRQHSTKERERKLDAQRTEQRRREAVENRRMERRRLASACFDAIANMEPSVAVEAGINGLWQRVRDHLDGEQ